MVTDFPRKLHRSKKIRNFILKNCGQIKKYIFSALENSKTD